MDEFIPARPPVKRRRYTKTFKTRIIAACERPGASVAGVALANSLNANLVHKWRRLAKAGSLNQPEQPGFLSIPMAMMGNRPSADATVMIEVEHLKIHWPMAHIDRAIDWLRLLRS